MRQLQPILINGKPIEEGQVVNTWFENRFNANKNILLAVIGATGSGKSYSCIRMCELWYKHKFNEMYPLDNICFSIKDIMQRIMSGKLRRGEILILEESGVIMGNLDFQNKYNKFFGYVLQSFRSKNIGIIFNLPNFSMLSKQARTLLHGVFETMTIDKQKNKVIIKPFYLQTNAFYGKAFTKYLHQKVAHTTVKVRRLNIGMPSPEILKPYEEKKDKFVNATGEILVEAINEKENGGEKENSTGVTLVYEAIKPFWAKGIKGVNELKRIASCDYKTIRKAMNKLVYEDLNALNQAKPLENVVLMA